MIPSSLLILLILTIGCLLIASYNVLGSILSRRLNFKYVWLALGSFYFYGLIAVYLYGFGNITIALIGTFFIGVFDATIGLLIAEKFEANIPEEDKEDVAISPKLTFQMGAISSVIGVISIVFFS